MIKSLMIRSVVFALCAIGLAEFAHADGTTTGQIGTIQTVGSAGGAPGNYDFRVSLAGGPIICNGQNWAYINTTDANYSAIVASILSARVSSNSVYLYWIQASNGFCEITDVSW
jgi:hypothetical protein